MERISLRTRSVRAAVVAIACVTLLPFSFGTAGQAEPIRGAGSTFAAPAIAEWSQAYQDARADGGDFISPDWTVDYELVGSLAGVMRLDQTELDFAATDVPINPAELEKHGREQFPIVFGSVAVVANIDGFENGVLRLSGPVLANIYLGKIQSWSDPAIRALNPDAVLPDLKISVLYRKDGSGTTFVFTKYLSAVSADWKKAHGADTLIAWPLGTGAEGTQELIRAVRTSKVRSPMRNMARSSAQDFLLHRCRTRRIVSSGRVLTACVPR
ncbi:phosphate ABC transporter substrate-binding protein PstS [Phyllobacterium sophorae]|uniref:phosphate ABC transporter substrate-binding protein PstS n=1 Tax=Phyllobacterium sophorae TaxID=1520277 RepID=UPI002477CD98|nr:phosphate ABC transporter substrate-binding protein PstS [Phyllobacterium sophorae]